MTLEEFRKGIQNEMVPLAVKYIDAIIAFEEYGRSNIHHTMMDLARSYAKGSPYNKDEDVQLHLFMHRQSRVVTDFLEDKIGFEHNVGFNDRTKSEIKALGENMTNELCDLTAKLFPDGNAVLVFEDGQLKPGTVETPLREMS